MFIANSLGSRFVARFATVACWGILWASTAAAQSQLAKGLEESIQPLVKNYKGDVAVSVYHFESDTSWSLRGDVPMPTASLIKLPVMIEAYRQVEAGKVKLDQRIEVRKEDMVQGSGILTSHFSAGTVISLRDAIRLMMVYSDNTATNLVVDAIGLPATAKCMQELGYSETQLHAKVFRGDTSIAPERSKKYGLGSTTANDMVSLLRRLKQGELATKQSTEAMLDHMLACDDKSRFTLLLPSEVKVAHKTGSVTRVRTDAGLIMGEGLTIALCVLTDNNEDTRWTDDNAGNRLCAEVAKAAYEALAAKAEAAKLERPQSTEMKIGATGELVEALQRTLNARTEPKANLSVDGDFGPATEAAVKAFQKQKQIDASGVVDAATWKALGPLMDTAEPVAEPEMVNTAKLEKQSPDDPYGPPQVSCAAWVIVDRASGEVVAGAKENERMHFASTTKIMTAYLVLEYAKSHPDVLNEVITFSKRADDTNGSTAGIKVGEQLTVAELMYGLMLPSGNDASVAFAEHFGRKFAEDPSLSNEASYDHFIEKMNAKAVELGMKQTHFVNPHGMTDDEHSSTPSDLARLARAALELPRFRDYVTCRQYGCRVSVPGGYSRNVKWRTRTDCYPLKVMRGLRLGRPMRPELVWFPAANAEIAS